MGESGGLAMRWLGASRNSPTSTGNAKDSRVAKGQIAHLITVCSLVWLAMACVSYTSFDPSEPDDYGVGHGGLSRMEDGIQVYASGAPACTFRILGEVSTTTFGSSLATALAGDTWPLYKSIREAKKRGGDAIVILGATQDHVATSSSGVPVSLGGYKVIVTKCIDDSEVAAAPGSIDTAMSLLPVAKSPSAESDGIKNAEANAAQYHDCGQSLDAVIAACNSCQGEDECRRCAELAVQRLVPSYCVDATQNLLETFFSLDSECRSQILTTLPLLEERCSECGMAGVTEPCFVCFEFVGLNAGTNSVCMDQFVNMLENFVSDVVAAD
jgi:hypothetical protein